MSNWLWLLLLATLWAPSFLFIKIGLADFPPLTLAAILLYLVLRAGGQNLPRSWRLWQKFLVMGFFGNALPFALFSVGELYADSGLAAILNGATPLFTVILAHFYLSDEHLTPQKLGGVLLGFAGLLLIFLPEIGGDWQRQQTLWGIAAFTLASASYGLAIVFARRNLRGLPPLLAPTVQLTVASLYLLPVALLVERPFQLTPGWPALGSVLALALFGTAAAFVVYYRLVEKASATFLSLVTYILPPAGVVLGVVVLGEKPGWNALAGCLLIIVGVMGVNGALTTAWRRLVQPSAA